MMKSLRGIMREKERKGEGKEEEKEGGGGRGKDLGSRFNSN